MKKAPFDLVKAQAGHPLVTRDGRPVTDFGGKCIHNENYPHSAILSELQIAYTVKGQALIGVESAEDLFLLVEESQEAPAPTPQGPAFAIVEGCKFYDNKSAYEFARKQAEDYPNKTIYVYELTRAFKGEVSVKEQFDWETKV